METPILNKKQQKASLSGKKPKKQTIKNVVALPYTKIYWPEPCVEDQNLIKEALELNLPNLQKDKTSVPYQNIKTIPKEKRKEFRLRYNGLSGAATPLSNDIIFGVNSVSKALEDDLVDTVLVSGDVQPRKMVGHIMDQCILQKTPVLVIPELKKILLEKCGIASICIGLKNEIGLSTPLGALKVAVGAVWGKLPVPKNHPNYNRTQEIVYCEPEVAKMTPKVAEVDFYLYRDSTSERAFIPRCSPLKGVSMDTSSFLSFGNDPLVPDVLDKTRRESNFKSLKVKRLKGNPNRNKNFGGRGNKFKK